MEKITTLPNTCIFYLFILFYIGSQNARSPLNKKTTLQEMYVLNVLVLLRQYNAKQHGNQYNIEKKSVEFFLNDLHTKSLKRMQKHSL